MAIYVCLSALWLRETLVLDDGILAFSLQSVFFFLPASRVFSVRFQSVKTLPKNTALKTRQPKEKQEKINACTLTVTGPSPYSAFSFRLGGRISRYLLHPVKWANLLAVKDSYFHKSPSRGLVAIEAAPLAIPPHHTLPPNPHTPILALLSAAHSLC